ncbi:ROK family transcriptional regulator [Microlunatus speluncae]|uniref:ROK family transcriptional regulator n=1 Tax=Microlunatus speluncae TaxID=2594267 RepID=UPI0012663C94|nr:ROK family transcriptional regulator [Microlunatus speluncae]
MNAVADGADAPRLDKTAQSVALAVLRHGPIARAELARRLGLSSPSLTRLTKELIRTRLVRERPAEQRAATGRPSLPLEINGDAAHFVGIKIVTGAAYAVVTDLAGDVITRRRVGTRARAPGTFLNRVAELIKELRADDPRIRGVGVGIGGPVSDGNSVRHAYFLGWGEVEVGSILAAAVGLPVTVHNDVKALTLSQHWFGSGRDCQSLAVLTLGVGFGCAMVINDALITGDRGISGEIGHWQLRADGPECSEGHRGCASVMLTSGGLARLASEAVGAPLEFEECVRLARDGDPAVRVVLETSAYQLGQLCARVADLIAPERLILCGDGIDFAIITDDVVRRGLADHRSSLADPDDLIMERLDFFDWARGGAALAIRHYLLG